VQLHSFDLLQNSLSSRTQWFYVKYLYGEFFEWLQKTFCERLEIYERFMGVPIGT